MPSPEVTVCIPSIPPRRAMLGRAVASVLAQTAPAAALSITVDLDRTGAAVTRQRALDAVRTPWTAFLDDDDELYPQHLGRLLEHAEATGADFVYPWFEVHGGTDPFPQHFGRPFDPADPVQTTITVLVRTELAQAVGFTAPPDSATVGGQRHGEDYQFTLGCLAAGATIVHLPERTWRWHHHGANLSGLPNW